MRLVEKGKVARQVRHFPTTTQDLLELVRWLEGGECTLVAMEATGVYWKPVWHILDGHFVLILANAMHVKAVPGRKSVLRDGTCYRDLGPEYFARRNPAKLATKLVNRIRNLGYHVEISAGRIAALSVSREF